MVIKHGSGPLRRFAPRTAIFSVGGALVFATTALVGCSGLPATQSAFAPSLAVPGAGLPQSLRSQRTLSWDSSQPIRKNSQTESVLHRFAGGSDGASPLAGLTNVGGTLYGTTGGEGDASDYGTVFKITTSGTESVLHRFAGGSDGASPYAGLTNVGGTLYGTTEGGGASDNGTVFRITTSGKEKVLYSFAGGNDGAYPQAGLTNVGGTLYGTTLLRGP